MSPKPEQVKSQAGDPGRFSYRTSPERGERLRTAIVQTHGTVARILDELIDKYLDAYIREHRVNLRAKNLRPYRGKKIRLYR